MDTIVELQKAFVWLIRTGVGTRAAYCLFKMIQSDEEVALYKKRIKNVIFFYILAESVYQLKEIAFYYFG